MKRAPLVQNPGQATFSLDLARQRHVPLGAGRPSWRRSGPRGEYRWQVGDRALVYLGAVLPWTGAELELVAVLEGSRRYGAVVRGFDGVTTRLGGLVIGDKLRVDPEHLFALWTAEEEHEASQRGRKPYVAASIRRPPPPRR